MQFSVRFTARLLAVVCGVVAGTGGKPVMLEEDELKPSDRQVTQPANAAESDTMAIGGLDVEENTNSLDLKPTDRLIGMLVSMFAPMVMDVVTSAFSGGGGGLLDMFTKAPGPNMLLSMFNSDKVAMSPKDEIKMSPEKWNEIGNTAKKWMEMDPTRALGYLKSELTLFSNALENAKSEMRKMNNAKLRVAVASDIQLEVKETLRDLDKISKHVEKVGIQNQKLDKMVDAPEKATKAEQWIRKYPVEVVRATKIYLDNTETDEQKHEDLIVVDLNEAEELLLKLEEQNHAAEKDLNKIKKANTAQANSGTKIGPGRKIGHGTKIQQGPRGNSRRSRSAAA